MLYHSTTAVLLPTRDSTFTGPGRGAVAVERSGSRTVVSRALATSPLRLLMPNNHGHGAWVYLSTFGGGLVDGDHIDLRVRVDRSATLFLGTQASTKVYRSPRGCSQRMVVDAADGCTVAIAPEPVVCFDGARYEQSTHVSLGPDASLLLLDGYTSGRRARGERWAMGLYSSRTTIERGGRTALVDATRLDPTHGAIARRMGCFDVLLTLTAMGPRSASVREAMLTPRPAPAPGDLAVYAASPIGTDGAIARVAARSFESASLALRPSFTELTRLLGDDPFARKW
jgi:urease accessory protein